MTTVRTDEEIPKGYNVCNYCQRLLPRLELHFNTIYYSHGFLKRDVLQCNECIDYEIKARRINKSDNTGYAITPVTWEIGVYQSICESIKDLCSHKSDHIVNYYDAVKAAFLKEEPKPKPGSVESDRPYNPMPIRDYLLGLDIKDVNKIDKNLEALWPFTYLIVNTKTEKRIKVVNRDQDSLLVIWASTAAPAEQE
jgi:hypothetical protein